MHATRRRFRPRCELLEDRAVPAAGQPDLTFGPDQTGRVTTGIGFTSDLTLDVAIDPEGRIVAVGSGVNGSSTGDFAIARYTPEGLPDRTFGPGNPPVGRGVLPFDRTDAGDVATAVGLQTINGEFKIVVAGFVSKNGHPGDTDFAVVRFDANGLLDPSFGPNGTGIVTVPFDLGGDNHDEARDLVIQPDNRIVVVGFARRAIGDADFAALRLTANGFLDGSFGDGTTGPGKSVFGFNAGPLGQCDDIARGVALQDDNLILVGSQQLSTTDTDFAAVRMLPWGQVDTSFAPPGNGGRVRVDFTRAAGGSGIDAARKVAVLPDGRLVIVGEAEVADADFAIVRLSADAHFMDTTFSGDGKLNIDFRLGGSNADIARAVAIQDDGKIVVAGEASTSQGRDFAVVRLTPSGALDSTFNGTGKMTEDFNRGRGNDDGASAVAVQDDGKIVVGGKATSTVFGTEFALLRLEGVTSGGGGFDLGGLLALPPDLGLPALPAARNLTAMLDIIRVRLGKKRGGRSRFLVKLKNRSGGDIRGDLFLVIDGLRSAWKARVQAALGKTLIEMPANSPFLPVGVSVLHAGEEVELILSVAHLPGVNVRFQERVLGGTPDLL